MFYWCLHYNNFQDFVLFLKSEEKDFSKQLKSLILQLQFLYYKIKTSTQCISEVLDVKEENMLTIKL